MSLIISGVWKKNKAYLRDYDSKWWVGYFADILSDCHSWCTAAKHPAEGCCIDSAFPPESFPQTDVGANIPGGGKEPKDRCVPELIHLEQASTVIGHSLNNNFNESGSFSFHWLYFISR